MENLHTTHYSCRLKADLLFIGVFFIMLSSCSQNPVSVYQEAQTRNTIEAYDDFIKKYPDSELVNGAFKQRENLYFEKARDMSGKNQSDDPYLLMAIWDSYLFEYPKGKHADEVRQMRERQLYDLVEKTDSSSNYRIYLLEYPDGRYRSEAVDKREKAVFREVKAKNLIDDFDLYLIEYPSGQFAAEARRLREKAWADNALKKDTIESLDGYLMEYPQGVFVEKVNLVRQEVLYRKAISENSLALCQQYVLEYPGGNHAQEMLSRIDELTFEKAVSERSSEAVSDYIERFPQGRFVEKARKILGTIDQPQKILDVNSINEAELKAWEQTRKLDHRIQYEWFIKKYPYSRFLPEARRLLNMIENSENQ